MILITVLAIWLVSLCLHEYSHARVAYAGGDYTVADKGYLSMNPLKYMNPIQSLLIPAVFVAMGWIALPGGAVWIETWRLRSRGWQSLVSLAGPAANVVVLLVLAAPFLLGAPQETTMWLILAASCFWQAISIVLNLLPIPGLDGYGAIEPWLPREAREALGRFKNYGVFLIFILFMSSRGFSAFFSHAVDSILSLLHVDPLLARLGIAGMRFWER